LQDLLLQRSAKTFKGECGRLLPRSQGRRGRRCRALGEASGSCRAAALAVRIIQARRLAPPGGAFQGSGAIQSDGAWGDDVGDGIANPRNLDERARSNNTIQRLREGRKIVSCRKIRCRPIRVAARERGSLRILPKEPRDALRVHLGHNLRQTRRSISGFRT
jgi:hypothetical protein